jgi:parvulin-like peptidyl-prolyl isomerase
LAQAEDAFKQQGIDLNSPAGQETLKSLRQQVLDQMINEVVIAQQAEKEGIRVADADLNSRLAQMVQDAGSVDTVNAYLDKFQLSLGDFCAQMRSSMLGEKMLDRATSALPTQAEQVHVRQILVSTPALAQTLRDRARKGEDLSSLARQYSMDETSKPNGGDLGWVPKGILAPELDAVIFQLPLNQVSDVVTTQLGYHILQVLARDKARALPPEYVQNQRQSYFLTSLQGWRNGMKIERLVH